MSDSPHEFVQRLNLRPTNVKDYYARPKPREGFHPLTATQEELAAAGLPKRPDPKRDRKAYAKWHSLYSRAIRYVDPEIKILPDRGHAPLMRDSSNFGPIASTTSPNWAGNAIFAKKGQIFTQASGVFTVPGVSQESTGPFANFGGGAAATWVGIDGDGVSGDVFQAGTNQSVGSDPYAWTEWFPAPAAQVNLDVEPGDSMMVQVQILLLNPAADVFPIGEAVLVNQTQGNFTTVIMFGPLNNSKTPFKGNCAEWIVETPCNASCTSKKPQLVPMPFFGNVAFFIANAIDNKGKEVVGANGTAIGMTNGGNGPGRTTKKGKSKVVAVEMSDPQVFGVICTGLGSS